jgi:hypothetical protein
MTTGPSVAGKYDEHYARAPEQVLYETKAFLSRMDFYRGEIARFISESDWTRPSRTRAC